MKKQKFYLIPAEIVDSNFPDEIKQMRKTTLVPCEATQEQIAQLKKEKSLSRLINNGTESTKMKSIKAAFDLLSADTLEECEEMIKLIIAADETEMIDYIDGVDVWEKVELSFNVKQFLEQIDYKPEDWK